MAILLSAVAWAGHAHFRPFAIPVPGGRTDYSCFLLQHLSLGTTLVVFVSGLLVKTGADEDVEAGATATVEDMGLVVMSYFVLLLCCVFLLASLGLFVRDLRANIAAHRAGKSRRGVHSAAAIELSALSDSKGGAGDANGFTPGGSPDTFMRTNPIRVGLTLKDQRERGVAR